MYKTDIKNIRNIFLDVDGVLTDGRIGYGNGSDEETKFFFVRDGAGIDIIRQILHYQVFVLTGRLCKANEVRIHRDLQLDGVLEKCMSKAEGMRQLCGQHGITPEECLYIGDDLIDLNPMAIAGVSAAPADATPLVRERADWKLETRGGRGAVREAIDRLLSEQGILETTIEEALRTIYA